MLAQQLLTKRKRAAKREGPVESDPEIGDPVSSELARTPKPSRPVSLANLKWKKSQLPDVLEGFDGFMGLEEIDGVDLDYDKLEQKKTLKLKSIQAVEKSSRGDIFEADSFATFEDIDECNVPKKKRQKKKQTAKKATAKEPLGESSPSIAMRANDKPKISNQSNDTKCERADETEMTTKETALPFDNPFDALEDEEMDVSLPAWSHLSLPSSVLKALHSMNFTTPTPIQAQSIPSIMAGNDLIGKASTGSGKTLAFGLPILDHILSSGRIEQETKGVSALILAPTRELAQQITQHIESVAKFSSVSIVTITGGLSIQKQLRQLEYIPDIVVATPGRLWEIMSSQPGIVTKFETVKFLVLDEADRVLQEGHFKEVATIVEKLGDPRNRQTLVFSATFQKELQFKLGKGKHNFQNMMGTDDSLEYLLHKLRFRKPPRFVDANPETHVASAVEQSIIETAPTEKDYCLYYLLLRYPSRTLIFTNSISDVHRLAKLLTTLGIPAMGLHSNKQQKSRLKTLERFKANEKGILVASDVAARGLDIPAVQVVVHYHLPRSADLYVHRSGRTARGENKGLSIIICSPTETGALRKMLRSLDQVDANLKTFPIDTDLVGKLKPRVNIARKIHKIEDANKKKSAKPAGDWLAQAAEDLGVELSDSEERGQRDRKEEVSRLKKELRMELARPVRGGFSAKYLTKGIVNMAQMMVDGQVHDVFLGADTESALDSVKG